MQARSCSCMLIILDRMTFFSLCLRFDIKNGWVQWFFFCVFFFQGREGSKKPKRAECASDGCHQFFYCMVKGFDVLVSSHSYLFSLRKSPGQRTKNTKRLKGGGGVWWPMFHLQHFLHTKPATPLSISSSSLPLSLSLHTSYPSSSTTLPQKCPQTPTPASPGRSPPRSSPSAPRTPSAPSSITSRSSPMSTSR